jgi:hypothetical protein
VPQDVSRLAEALKLTDESVPASGRSRLEMRRAWLFDAVLLDEVRGVDVKGRRFGDVVRSLASHDPAAARAAVLRLLWRGELKTDLSTPLSDSHQLVTPA